MQEAGERLSPRQAAVRLGVTTEWVRRLCESGRLHHDRTALGRLIHAESVERYKREREARLTDGK